MAPPPPSWPGPAIPPPNFSVPPPNMCGGNFPRFSGPMHNQPSFPMGQRPRMPPPPHINTAIPPPNFRGGNHQNGNLRPRFNNAGAPAVPRTNPGSTRPPAPNHRPAGFVPDDIFGDTAPDVQSGFPYFNPHQPPPGMAPNQMNLPPRGGGHRGGGGGAGRGFGGQTGAPPPRGRGAFHGGMGRGGGQTRGAWGGNNNNNNNNNGGGRGGNNNNSIGGRGGNNNTNGGFGGNKNNRGGNNNNNAGGGQNGFQNKKKQKIDKRELPENNKFFCDRCERGFKDEEKYKGHVSEHQKCTYKDCPFVAAPKLVQLHMTMQHTGGLAKRVWSVATEEDVKKWKEDRRKNFPTAANIKKKKDQLDERIARGEVIETKDFSKMKRGRDQGRGRGRGKGRGRGRFQKGRHYDDRDDPQDKDTDDDDDGPPEEVKIRRTGAGLDKEAAQAPTSAVDSKTSTIDLTTAEPSPTIGLSLVTDYGSISSDEDDDIKDSKKTVLEAKNATEGIVTSSSTTTTKESSLLSPLYVSSSPSSPSLQDSGSAPKNSKNQESSSHTANHNHIQASSQNDDDTTAQDQTPRSNTLGENSTEKGQVTTTPVLSENDGKGDATMSSGKDKSVPSLSSPTKEGDEPKQKDGDVAMETGGDTSSNTVAEVNKGTKRGHGSKDGPRQKKQKIAQKPQPKSYTLLEKLLSTEIRRERNKILQCVHFIVKNKFFQGGLTQ